MNRVSSSPKRRRLPVIIFTLLLSFYPFPTLSSNWVQVSGSRKLQNSVEPAKSLFSPRWGHALVVKKAAAPPLGYETIDECFEKHRSDLAEEECTNINENGDSMIDQLFVLGGESQDTENHGGGPLNDVWTTLGTRFTTEYAGVKVNAYGEPEIRRLSNTKWLSILYSDAVKSDLDYYEKMACLIENSDMYPVVPCTSSTQETETRWLPRRHMGAVVKSVANQNKIFLFGGLTQLSVDLPSGWERMHGGITPPRGTSLRYPEVAMNDVWVSRSGKTWDLVTPGCLPHVHQKDITLETSGYGRKEASCTSDLDCKMDSHCDVALGSCVCNMWSPRENFASAVFTITTEGDDGAPIFTDHIFVVGGFTYVNQNKCGQHACVGGYRKALNDVWHSTDGKTWLTEPYGTLNAGFKPRGGHGIVVMRSSMWIAGGQGSNPLNSSDHPFYNDLWTFGKSTDYVWTHSGEDLAPKWSPRAYFSMVKGGESVEDAYVIAGETEDGVTNEVWRWWQSGSQWLKDYGENADTGVLFDESHYVSIHDSIEKMDPGKYWNTVPEELRITKLTDAQIEKLRQANITKISHFRDLTSDQFRALLHKDFLHFPDLCVYITFAKRVIDKCDPKKFIVDTDDLEEEDQLALFEGIVERAGQERILEFAMKQRQDANSRAADFCNDVHAFDTWYLNPEDREHWDELSQYIGYQYEGSVPLFCKSVFDPLAYGAGLLYQSRVYLIGGRSVYFGDNPTESTQSTLSNNVFYRDGVHPKILVEKNPPQSGSGDLEFVFGAQDDLQTGSTDLANGLERELIFEYQVWNWDDEPSLVRQWTQTRETLDAGTFIDSAGKYKIEARAVDLSGHRDNPWGESVLNWEYIWDYEPPLPIGLILGVIVSVIVAGLLTFTGYRYYKRREALKRFALKRLRRKFKRVQRERVKKDKKFGKQKAKLSRKEKMKGFLEEAKKREKAKKKKNKKSGKGSKKKGGSRSPSPKRKGKKKKGGKKKRKK